MNSASDKARGAIVVGGGTGLGLASAKALAEAGWRVFLTGRRADVIDRASASMPPGVSSALAGDATREADVERVVAAAQAFLGDIHALVVSSGATAVGSVVDAAYDDVVHVLHTNLLPLFLFGKHTVRNMPAGGAIVAIASVAGTVPHPERLAYCASKAGLIGMVRQMALDLAPRRIRVNAVSPSLVLTDLARSAIAQSPDPEATLANRLSRHPLGRLGTVEEVGAAVAYLCSDEAAWITGQNLILDGGLSLAAMQATLHDKSFR
ncbi:MAG TPA: SDR family oxidoreductase [Hyphomicrobiaceae bacterium]